MLTGHGKIEMVIRMHLDFEAADVPSQLIIVVDADTIVARQKTLEEDVGSPKWTKRPPKRRFVANTPRNHRRTINA